MHRKKSQLPAILLLLLVCLLFLSACGEQKKNNSDEAGEAEKTSLFCNGVNAQGSSVQAFRNTSDGVWYLMVPSSWNLAEMELHCYEKIQETERGELSQETSSISGAFAKHGDTVVLKTEDGDLVTVSVLQSDLPCVQIDLHDLSLEEVHEDKSKKHYGNSVLITDADGSIDVESSNDVELKGRGNSTWQFYEKKGYQIKFSQETDVLGMGKADTWVLLSNASDDSMLRSRVVYTAAKQLNMKFVPDFVHVDLWVSGEYRGTYMIGEKVELGESRLDLKTSLGTLFERDDAFYGEEAYWIYNNYLEARFVLKENIADREQLFPKVLEDFSKSVDQLMQFLYTTPSAEVTLEQLKEMIDVDSFALYYLVNEYVQNRESMSTSFNWYQDGPDDVIHLGPIWDFDTCMGNDGAEFNEYYCYKGLVFKYLLAVPEFYQRTQELYLKNKKIFDSMADTAAALGERIHISARANYLRWEVLGSESIKPNGAPFAESYSEALINLTNWLSKREMVFKIPRHGVVTSTVSDDCGTLHIRYSDDRAHESLWFICRNQSSADNLNMWYDGVLTDGEWTADVNLSSFGERGMYCIDVYTPGGDEPIAGGVNYVASVNVNPYVLQTAVSEDMNQVTITLADPKKSCNFVNFAIWSRAENRKDLQTFNAEKNADGLWCSTVDLTAYDAEGEYYIHVFGETSVGYERLNATMFIRYPIWAEGENPYLIQTEISEDVTSVTITVTVPKDDCSLVNFLVWSSAGGQNDLQVFPAVRIGEGLWSYTVDLTQYEAEGEYNVHVFGEKPYDYIKLNTAVFNVEFSHE